MKNGQLDLHYNYELDELFLIKRGVFGRKYLLEDHFGTSLFETLEDLESSSNLLDNSIFIQEL